MCQHHTQSQSSVENVEQVNHSSEGNTMDRMDAIRECKRKVVYQVELYATRINARVTDRQVAMLHEVVDRIIETVAPEVKPLIICEECGTDDYDMLEDNKCEGCFMKCDGCEQIIHRDHAIDDDYCEDCAVKCQDCGEVATMNDAEWCDFYANRLEADEWLCESCGAECHECGEVERREDMGTDPDMTDIKYCETCSTECESCGNRHGDEYMTEVDNMHYCHECVDSAKESYEASLRLELSDDLADIISHFVTMLRPDIGEVERAELIKTAIDEVFIGGQAGPKLELYDVLVDIIKYDN